MHPGMGSTPGAIRKCLMFRVGDRDPQPVPAMLGVSGYGGELPVPEPWDALVLVQEM